ncbi:MAG: carbamoyltransferase HypF [Clostridiales bacterium]|jgi:hydrogenase maturation protein HypF|nr:carbamoyltransferase HypF [Clostridiales bacterium]
MTVFITVFGIVQGVGYRPFVAAQAKELGVKGWVRNSGGIVEITASGGQAEVEAFVRRLHEQRPEGARVSRVRVKPLPEERFDSFRIDLSGRHTDHTEAPVLPPDIPMCESCKKELYNPKDRRYRYPFISCASCGPRYSIMNTLPYDRGTTTMRDFVMCPACEKEYQTGRRCHAQTISCHDCGPQLILRDQGMAWEKEEAFSKAVALLRNGGVLALKGVGGYQFVCCPEQETAVERLRLLKAREKKPFAVMFPSVESIRAHCSVSEEEEELLKSTARPIVLLRITEQAFCPQVSGDSRFLGAFLPCTGLHQMLTDTLGPLVVTSGNFTTEPIIYKDEDMLNVNSPFLSGVLYHTRRILSPLDDSVARVFAGKTQIIRRSRGYVPLPILLAPRPKKPVLAMGGDLKSSFCLYKGGRAYVSQYFGDMENYQVSRNYRNGMKHMERLLRIEPIVVACDMHPGYHTTTLGEELAAKITSADALKFQHHHAHAASVMAEHHLDGCIGVVFDGTGYGTDETVWGGEFLLCRGKDFVRRAHLKSVPLCGGDAVAKNAVLAADCYRSAAGESWGSPRYEMVQAALKHRINTQDSSSVGRLFDAVSALLGIREENGYEGECAIALENAAAAAKDSQKGPSALGIPLLEKEDGEIELDQVDLVSQILQKARVGVDRERIALGFHEALSDAVLAVCRKIRAQDGEKRVALSGGVFANLLLLEQCYAKLTEDGFDVYLNSAVPCNDGGICLGQAWLAAMTQEEENSK